MPTLAHPEQEPDARRRLLLLRHHHLDGDVLYEFRGHRGSKILILTHYRQILDDSVFYPSFTKRRFHEAGALK